MGFAKTIDDPAVQRLLKEEEEAKKGVLGKYQDLNEFLKTKDKRNKRDKVLDRYCAYQENRMKGNDIV